MKHAKTIIEPTLASSNSAPYPPIPATHDGQIRLTKGLSKPTTDKSQVALGAQSPMFPPKIIVDKGLVRIGAQSPIF